MKTAVCSQISRPQCVSCKIRAEIVPLLTRGGKGYSYCILYILSIRGLEVLCTVEDIKLAVTTILDCVY